MHMGISYARCRTSYLCDSKARGSAGWRCEWCSFVWRIYLWGDLSSFQQYLIKESIVLSLGSTISNKAVILIVSLQVVVEKFKIYKGKPKKKL